MTSTTRTHSCRPSATGFARSATLIGSFLALVATCTAANAEDSPPFSVTVAADGGSSFAERPHTGSGSLDVDWEQVEGRLFWRPHPALRIGIGAGISRDGYRATGELDGAGLPDEIRQAWVRLPVAMMFHPHWGLSFQGSLGTGTDGEASAHTGRQWQVEAGMVYVRDPDLIVCLLVNLSSHVDDRRPTIFPFPSVYWRFHQDWRLTVVDEVDNLSHLRYAFSDQCDVGLRVDVRFREAALEGNRVLNDDHIATAVQATWMPAGRGRVEITPFVGTQLLRRLTIRDTDGNERWSTITAPAALLGLDLRAAF